MTFDFFPLLPVWDAKVYFLCIVFAFFTGAWPYIKLLAMVFCVLAPSKVLSVHSREVVLKFMDIFGKWSLVDIFVMVMMMSAFVFDLKLLPQVEVVVTVVPHWSFYEFLLATVISIALGHVILACHRHIEDSEPQNKWPDESAECMQQKSRLLDHVYAIRTKLLPKSLQHSISEAAVDDAEGAEGAEGADLKPNEANSYNHSHSRLQAQLPMLDQVTFVKVSKLAYIVLFASLACASVLLYYGTTLDILGFSFRGLIGFLLKDAADADYSFIDIGRQVPQASGDPGNPKVQWLEVSYFILGLGMPALLVVCLACLWVLPLTVSMQRRVMVFSEMVNSFAALDVFCVSVGVTMLDMQQVRDWDHANAHDDDLLLS